MKERHLFFFITAVSFSTLVILSLLVRSFIWFSSYGHLVMPSTHHLLIPLVLVWLAWYFEDKLSLISACVMIAVLFGFHLDGYLVLSGTPFIPSVYAPMVRTVYVLVAMLLLSTVVLGYVTHFLTKGCCKAKKESE